jgi:uncharacterized membrane protein (UPF0127 family)
MAVGFIRQWASCQPGGRFATFDNLTATRINDMTFIKTRTINPLLAAVLALVASASGAWAQQVPQHLPAITLSAGMHNIVAEVARTEEQRQIGLMFRKQMATHEGMLFVFEEPATQCFWMRNTLIPLAAAFVDDTGTIVNVEEMAPQTDASHCSKKPVRFVLEMNQGWFAKRGFTPGFKLSGPPFH